MQKWVNDNRTKVAEETAAVLHDRLAGLTQQPGESTNALATAYTDLHYACSACHKAYRN